MELEYSVDTTCSVTHHLVDEVSRAHPEQLMQDGEVSVYRTLYFLGFDIKNSLYNKNVTKEYDKLIRSMQYPRKCYYASVYTGFLRNKIKSVDTCEVDGKLIKVNYDKGQYHFLKDSYNKHEVLQAGNIDNYVTFEEFLDIDSFGG